MRPNNNANNNSHHHHDIFIKVIIFTAEEDLFRELGRVDVVLYQNAVSLRLDFPSLTQTAQQLPAHTRYFQFQFYQSSFLQ